MTPELRDDLLHYIGSARGISTADLLAEIDALRPMGLWPHSQPTSATGLQRLLVTLQGQGQIAKVAEGWMLASQVRNVQPGPRVLPALFE